MLLQGSLNKIRHPELSLSFTCLSVAHIGF